MVVVISHRPGLRAGACEKAATLETQRQNPRAYGGTRMASRVLLEEIARAPRAISIAERAKFSAHEHGRALAFEPMNDP
jgi:hypothetical protein